MKKTFGFIYEDEVYIATLGNAAIRSAFPYSNAVRKKNLGGKSALSYYACSTALQPCSTLDEIPVLSSDATVTKEGESFVVTGSVCVGAGKLFKVHMDASDIEVTEESIETQETEVTEQKVPEPEVQKQETETEPEPLPDVPEPEPVKVESPKQGPAVTTGIHLGVNRKPPAMYVRRLNTPTQNAPVQQQSKPTVPASATLTVDVIKKASFTKDEIFTLADHFVTLAKLYMPAEPEHVKPIEQPVVEQTTHAGFSFGKVDMPNLGASSPGVVPVTPIVSKEEPEVKEVANADMSSFADVLACIPARLLTNCSAYTASTINKSDVIDGGALYCSSENWTQDGHWYAIDEISSMSRHFLNAETGAYYAIPVSDIKVWVNANY